MKNNLRAVIYFRSNNREQFETENDIQAKMCKEYAEQNNMQIIGTYKDQFVSGRTAKNRDGFNQMIEDSSKDLFDVVLIHRIDRFSRSAEDYFTFENVLYKNGVELISVTSPLDELNTRRTLVALIASTMEENLHDNK